MVDNVAITAGSGTNMATDDIGGVHYPRAKMTWGPDGTANDVDVASGKPLPVQLRSPTGTDLTGTAGTGSAAVLTVQGNASGTAVPVSLATVPSHAVTNAGTFAVQAAATLAAETTKVIGTVNIAAAQTLATVTTVGAVTAISNALPAGTNLLGKVDVQFAGTVPDTGSGTGGSKTQRVIIDSSQFSALGATTKTASVSTARATDEVLGFTVTQAASSTITRPADTTAYASGDLVANSTTAGSVNALQFTTLARISGGSGVIVGAQIQKSTTSTTNAAFRLHLFNTVPTFTSAGDNSAISSVVVASAKGYLGYIDITAMVGFSDVAWGSGAPDNSRGGIPYVATAQIIYGILEARGAYTPGNAEVFTITLDAIQD